MSDVAPASCAIHTDTESLGQTRRRKPPKERSPRPDRSGNNLSVMTDQEARDLVDDCTSASKAVIAASGCRGQIEDEELAQLLFLKFFGIEENRRGWWALKLGAFRLLIDELERDKRRRNREATRENPVTSDPCEALGRQEAAGVLVGKIRSTLSQIEIAVLALYYEVEVIEGKKGAYAIIAETLQINRRAVAVYMYRIRAKARRFLAEYEECFAD